MNLVTRFGGGSAKGASRLVCTLALLALSLMQAASVGLAAVPVGANVRMVASADADPAPTFQWRKNGNAIPGATDSVLTLAGVTMEDAGTYQVVATNPAGSSVSPDTVLTVVTTEGAPVIVTHPTSQSAIEGDTITLTASASGSPAPAYQWQKNGVPLAGATNATLTLASLTLSDSAAYVLVATNDAGTASSNPAILTVTDSDIAPTFTTHPVSQSVAAGNSVTFTAAATGTPTPTLQWLKNNVAIPGATGSTLTLSSLTSSDGGTYAAMATNAAGSISSNGALLTVTEPTVVPPPPPPTPGPTAAPVITTQPVASQTITAGTSATITVAASGNPAPTYQWRKNGSNIAGATNATLTLKTVTSADAANYSVVVSNSLGTVVSDNSLLVVQMAPVISTQPVAQAVAAGATARFSVVVAAIPGATLQWYKDGVAIPGATSAVLTLTAVAYKDVGNYSVVASNLLGSVTSKTVSLIIAAPPVITSQPQSQIVSTKTSVTFAVGATGSPAPTYQWKKNGASIPGATKPTFTLKSVNKYDSATYSVDISNVVGWTSSNRVTLTVYGTTGKGPNETDGDSGVPTVEGDGSMDARLVNLSVRATAGAGADGLIVGFVINGPTTKPVLIRGIGPTLRDFGVINALADPKLGLYSGSTLVTENDDWGVNENAVQIAETSARVGAFGLGGQAADAALMATLESGAYTAQVTGKDANNGVALVEVYDAATTNAAKLVNLSVRARIGTGEDAPAVGFVVSGNGPKRVMIRAAGPALAAFGVTDAIADPQIELFKGDVRLNQNDDWAGSDAMIATFNQVGAFPFPDASSRDAVLLTTLEPGPYTVVVSGVAGTSGIGLVELYEVP